MPQIAIEHVWGSRRKLHALIGTVLALRFRRAVVIWACTSACASPEPAAAPRQGRSLQGPLAPWVNQVMNPCVTSAEQADSVLLVRCGESDTATAALVEYDARTRRVLALHNMTTFSADAGVKAFSNAVYRLETSWGPPISCGDNHKIWVRDSLHAAVALFQVGRGERIRVVTRIQVSPLDSVFGCVIL